MTLRLDLRIDSFWISSSGRGRALLLDGETVIDRDGFPYVPGRHLKGLLRHAVRQLESWGAIASGRQFALFGEGGKAPQRQGGLRFTDAELPAALRAAPTDWQAQLFETLSMTAMDAEAGVARTGTLRVLRVAVPMLLRADIEWEGPEPEPADWRGVIEAALPHVRAIGAHRHRGMGRAFLSVAA